MEYSAPHHPHLKEYKVITVSPQSNKAAIELNMYAEEGWVVATCVFHPMNMLVYTLERNHHP